jgi:Tfp pilus assembly protein PilV
VSTGRAQRGISLIEAVVALAVMAFGMLAYAGLQNSLRFNGDVAKQRSEAVRIAQEQVEQWRAFSVIETTEDRTAYDALLDSADDPIPPIEGDNASYTLTRTVVDAPSDPSTPRMKTLVVDVEWDDRNGERQRVRLSTTIAASPPELAGTLAVPGAGGPPQLPQGRNPAVPAGADMRGDNKSIFMPPVPGGGVLWVFDNLTGVIVGVCNTVVTGQAQVTQADTQACIDNTSLVGLQLSGFVRFATDNPPNGATKHSAAVAENPPNAALNLGVVLTNLSSAGNANPTYVCYTDAPTSYLTTQTAVAYRCAILFNKDEPLVWSGISELLPLPFHIALPPDYVAWAIADDADDARASRYRICRYTPASSDSQPIPNRLHPRTYIDVDAQQPLLNQNFLVIRAGSDIEDGTGGTPFTCPTDVPADPAAGDFVNSNTFPHQPPPAAP